MLPDFLRPRWLRVAIAVFLLAMAFLTTTQGWLGTDVFYGDLEVVPAIVIAILTFPAIALLGSILFDFIGSDPETEDYSPEAVERRIAARQKDRSSS